MSKQTATEWLIEQVKSKEWQDMFIWHKEEVFNQAKAMDKGHIIDAYKQGQHDSEPIRETDSEQYYNQTFKGGQQ